MFEKQILNKTETNGKTSNKEPSNWYRVRVEIREGFA